MSESSEIRCDTLVFNIRVFISVWWSNSVNRLNYFIGNVNGSFQPHFSYFMKQIFTLLLFLVGIPSILRQSLPPYCSFSSLSTQFLIFSFSSSEICFCKRLLSFSSWLVLSAWIFNLLVSSLVSFSRKLLQSSFTLVSCLDSRFWI